MHRFGGIYSDLDLVALSSLSDHIPILKHDTPPPIPIAYLGHMGDDNYEHSIPNAFMVSTAPGHPFWLKPLDFVKEHQLDEAYNAQPEGLTGPVALRTCLKQWENDREEREGSGTFSDVRVLPNDKVCRFFVLVKLINNATDLSVQLVRLAVGRSREFMSAADGDRLTVFFKCLCRLHSPFFNETRCHYRHPTAWTIT
jgi:hypothetical protein